VPANPREHEIWVEERRGAIVLLGGLADWNRQLLRSAATCEWVSITVRDLLLAAMKRMPVTAAATRIGADPKADPQRTTR